MSKSKFGAKRWVGLVLIALSWIIFAWRPFQTCEWWNILCGGLGLIITLLAAGLSLILLTIGVILLIKG